MILIHFLKKPLLYCFLLSTITFQNLEACSPAIIAHSVLNVNLGYNKSVEINAADFDIGSYSNCEEGPLQFSFSYNPGDKTLILDCDDRGSKEQLLVVTDAHGNQNGAMVLINTQDSYNDCENTNAPTCSPVSTMNFVNAVLSPNNSIVIPVNALVSKNLKKCNPSADSDYSAASGVQSDFLYFNCDLIGSNFIQIFETNGNEENRTDMIVNIQEDNDNCSNPPVTNDCELASIVKGAVTAGLDVFGQVEIAADMFNAASYLYENNASGCTDYGAPQFSFSPDVNDTHKIFNCNDLEKTSIRIYITSMPTNPSLEPLQNYVDAQLRFDDAFSACVPEDETVNEESISTGTYRACNDLSSNGNVPPGESVSFKAGNSVILEGGFSVEEGATFSAETETVEDQYCVEGILGKEDITFRNSSTTPSITPFHNNQKTIPSSFIAPSIEVYPNPTTGQLTVFWELDTSTEIKMELLNWSGKVVRTFLDKQKSASGQYEFTINLYEIPSGVYFLNTLIGTKYINKKIFLNN